MFDNLDPKQNNAPATPTPISTPPVKPVGAQDIFAGVNPGGITQPPRPPAPQIVMSSGRRPGILKFIVIFLAVLIVVAGAVFAGAYVWVTMKAKPVIITNTNNINNLNTDNTNTANTNTEVVVPVENTPSTELGAGNTNIENVNNANTNTEVIVPPPVDTDGDGLTDSQEVAIGTNPSFTDTDNDGLSDGQEINIYSTNPLNPDTDGDTFLDGAEVAAGYDPNGTGKLPNSNSNVNSSNTNSSTNTNENTNAFVEQL